MRRYPRFDPVASATRSLSFVTVRFSDDFVHNLAISPCVRDARNELIVVENRGNVFHRTLSEALCAGIARARHDLIALVHEDVVLLEGWQAAFQRALTALEAVDPAWWLIGVAGWDDAGAAHGHWSDPHGYTDALQARAFAEVQRIDEQLMVFRRGDDLRPDPALPGIHNIGRDLACAGGRLGRRTYVVNAPTVHKYADAAGRLIQSPLDSPKIRARATLTYLADKAASDDYLARKWNLLPDQGSRAGSGGRDREPPFPPVVLLGRGGGGSRLLSVLAQDAGVFLGHDLGPAGDSMTMVPAVYKGVLGKWRYADAYRPSDTVSELRRAAAALAGGADVPETWGFKLPESMLLLDEIAAAFPGARFVHLVRDPLATCLRRTHMTARLDNQIGQATLAAAYRWGGRDGGRLLEDSPAVHMAITTQHQLALAMDFCASLSRRRLMVIRFEDLIVHPEASARNFRNWLDGRPAVLRWLRTATRRHAHPTPEAGTLAAQIDDRRASQPLVRYPDHVVAEVTELLAPLRRRLGYLPAGDEREERGGAGQT